MKSGLRMISVKITDEGLKHLTGIEEGLEISCGEITDAGIYHIKDVKKNLSLHDCTNLTDKSMEFLRSV